MFIKYLIFLTFSLTLLNADPWGKDADLCLTPETQENIAEPSLVAKMASKAIRFHKEFISPTDGPRSHFYPNSSQYALDAIKKYGFIEGFTRGCDRLLRENSDPWLYRKTYSPKGPLRKWDPVR